ncbi:MAG: site-specific integrase, partial [Acidobacteria bacterium]|nr:site-specific integrase [Acidobacteriota bacterium]
MAMMIDAYVAYLRDVRRLSPNTIESYARDLAQ